MKIERCRDEIATIEGLIIAGHPDLEGLCLALSDWCAELRLIEREMDHKTKKARRSRSRGGRNSSEGKLLTDRVDALAVLAFGGFEGQSHLLAKSTGEIAPDRVILPAG
jgi:hypothetical protein